MLRRKKWLILGGLMLLLLFSAVAAQAATGFFSSLAQASTSNNSVVSAPLSTAFTYQGHLTENGALANGAYDFQFILYDAVAGGAQVGATETAADLPVTDGMFTAVLDFGAVFAGTAVWLEIGVREGNSSGVYTILTPRQPLTGTPYALGLQPGANILGNLTAPVLTLANGTGDGLVVTTAGNATGGNGSVFNNGIEVEGAEGHGLYIGQPDRSGVVVGTAGESGVRVGHAAGDGVLICATGSASGCDAHTSSNGVEVVNAEANGLRVNSAGNHGVLVESAGLYGFRVNNAVNAGMRVGHSDGDGLVICNTGTETGCPRSDFNNAIEIGNAEHYGVFVGSTGGTAVSVDSAGGTGVYVGSAGSIGVAVVSAGFDGVYVDTAGDDGIDVQGNDLAGHFFGSINVTGSCTGCLLATFGLNSGRETLQPGDLVTILGMRPSGVDSVPMLMEVARAGEGAAVVGVVQGWAELKAVENPRPAELGQRLIPREGATAPGQYVTIIIYGPVQVQASDRVGTITPGVKLALDGDGRARSLQTVTVDGMQLAESAPTIGTALSEPDENGMVWVLLNPQ